MASEDEGPNWIDSDVLVIVDCVLVKAGGNGEENREPSLASEKRFFPFALELEWSLL